MAAVENICAAHLKIAGRVQGVYYRASAVQQAQQLRLSGWVINCPDGSVEAWAEGPKENVERFIAWCRQGPPGARVANLGVEWQAPKNYQGFEIKR